MGKVGVFYDTALIKSFSRRIQAERFNTKTETTVEEPSIAIAEYIENFHNTCRRPSAPDARTLPGSRHATHPNCSLS